MNFIYRFFLLYGVLLIPFLVHALGQGLHGQQAGIPTLDDAMHAIERGDMLLVEEYITNGGDVNAPWKLDLRLIGTAAAYGDEDILLLLLEHGADIHARDAMDGKAIDYAVEAGHINATSVLLAHGASANELLASGETLLTCAIKKRDEDMTRLLIEAGADLYLPNAAGMHPLIVGIRTDNVSAVKALLTHNVDPNREEDEPSPLEVAIARGLIVNDTSMVRALLEHGANQNFLCKTPFTVGATSVKAPPLAFPVFFGSLEMVKLLMRHGADPSLGRNLVDIAAITGHDDIRDYLVEHGLTSAMFADSNMLDSSDMIQESQEARDIVHALKTIQNDRNVDMLTVDGDSLLDLME